MELLINHPPIDNIQVISHFYHYKYYCIKHLYRWIGFGTCIKISVKQICWISLDTVKLCSLGLYQFYSNVFITTSRIVGSYVMHLYV